MNDLLPATHRKDLLTGIPGDLAHRSGNPVDSVVARTFEDAGVDDVGDALGDAPVTFFARLEPMLALGKVVETRPELLLGSGELFIRPLEFFVSPQEFGIHLLLPADIPDRLDSTDTPALPVIERRCPDHDDGLAAVRTGEIGLAFEDLPLPHHGLVRAARCSIGSEDVVDQDRARLAIERNRIRVIALAKHPGFRNTEHLLDCTVPGDHAAAGIDDEGRVREEVDDIGKLAFAL